MGGKRGGGIISTLKKWLYENFLSPILSSLLNSSCAGSGGFAGVNVCRWDKKEKRRKSLILDVLLSCRRRVLWREEGEEEEEIYFGKGFLGLM